MFGPLTAQRRRRFIPYFLLDDGPPTPPDLPPEPPTNTPMTPPDMPPLTPMSPVPPPPPDSYPSRRRDFFIGLGFGLLPLVVAMVGIGGVTKGPSDTSVIFSDLLAAGGILWVVSLIVMIVFLAIKRLRNVGLGLVASVVSSPVIFFIGCIAFLATPRP
jgi:hypothetical protein